MKDDETITDAELAARVAAHDEALAQKIRARLRRLRLARIVTPEPASGTTSPQVAGLATLATTGENGHPRQF